MWREFVEKNRWTRALAPLVVGIMILIGGSCFIVNETEQAIVLRFGKLQRLHNQPGLKFKLPFVEEAILYDKRLLTYNLRSMEVFTGDRKRLVMNLFVKYYIRDPLLFYKRLRTEAQAQSRLESIIASSMRRVAGKVPLLAMLSPKRSKLMEEIQTIVKEAGLEFGVYVHDVRISRTDLPANNMAAIIARMKVERYRDARKIRAEGEKRSQEIRAQADRKSREIIAEANSESNVIRGAGEAEMIRIHSAAFSQDIEFYRFYRTLQAYEKVLDDKTVYIMDPNDYEFFKHLVKDPV